MPSDQDHHEHLPAKTRPTNPRADGDPSHWGNRALPIRRPEALECAKFGPEASSDVTANHRMGRLSDQERSSSGDDRTLSEDNLGGRKTSRSLTWGTAINIFQEASDCPTLIYVAQRG